MGIGNLRHFDTRMTLWQLLALEDAALEQADVVLLNLCVAKGIPSLADLNIARYVRVVDDWTQQFARVLPGMEANFRKTPERWENDIRFFRIGMLQGFLGHEIGIRYIDEQWGAKEVSYTNPGDLFLHGVIDTKQGTCANMAALHVAMARRMGWPVSLACVKSHFISRFDDGTVTHNIEATSNHPGSFASGSDEDYIKKLGLPRKAIECGSDLRKLTAREMIGVFLSLRGRHYTDTGLPTESDSSYALARVIFPLHRRAYIGAMAPMLARGATLFNRGEVGHPDSLFQEVRPYLSLGPSHPLHSPFMGQSPPMTPARPVVVGSVVDVLEKAFGTPITKSLKPSQQQQGPQS
jgi:hypothetical protein